MIGGGGSYHFGWGHGGEFEGCVNRRAVVLEYFLVSWSFSLAVLKWSRWQFSMTFKNQDASC